MTGRGLTDEELAMELEYLSDSEVVSGFSDDSTEDKDFSPEDENSDSTSEDEIVETQQISDYSSEDDIPLARIVRHKKWELVSGPRNNLDFTLPYTGVRPDVVEKLRGKNPIDYFKHFIDDEIISLLVRETNRFAARKFAAANASTSRSRVCKWVDTDDIEMQKFLGIILWMGLIQFPQLRDYWSTNILYENGISKMMSRNRFELLLSMFHLCNNEGTRDLNDRLYNISELIDLLQPKFKESYIPEEQICIDESNVSFRGRIHFRQYNPNKRHEYGIKVFKLCVSGGYTWSFKVYTGKERADDISVAEKVISELMDGLFGSGRTLYTDNWYTSIALSKRMLQRKTHLVGTLRLNRKNNPPNVVKSKLKRGQVVAEQNEDKTVVLKWKDKRDVAMLSTKHDDSMVYISRRGKELTKPAMVVDYNQGKAFVDLSDQMVAYAPFVRRTVKWYKRLAFHLLTSSTVVNALHLYNKVNHKKMSIIKFREAIVEAMVCSEKVPDPTNRLALQRRHRLKEAEGQKRVTRKRCSTCYKTMSRQHGAPYARKNARKINTFCDTCNIPICIQCFPQHQAIN